MGVQNLEDTNLYGSAAPFAKALQHDDSLFYVRYFARDCSGLSPCLEIPRKLVTVGDRIKIIQRNYVNPGSRRGPDPTTVLDPLAIVLDGLHRPKAH